MKWRYKKKKGLPKKPVKLTEFLYDSIPWLHSIDSLPFPAFPLSFQSIFLNRYCHWCSVSSLAALSSILFRFIFTSNKHELQTNFPEKYDSWSVDSQNKHCCARYLHKAIICRCSSTKISTASPSCTPMTRRSSIGKTIRPNWSTFRTMPVFFNSYPSKITNNFDPIIKTSLL